MIRALAWVGGVLAVVAIATGVYAAFRYRPDATGFGLGMQRLHALSSIAFAVVVVIGLAAFVWERRPDRRHGLPAFAAIAVIGLVLVVQTVIGGRIAWDQVALWAVVGPDSLHHVRGVFLRDLPLKFVITDATELGVGSFRRHVWVHLVVLPVLVGLGVGSVVVWTRRFARPEARPVREPGAGA